MKIAWSAQSRTDLRAIHTFIARDSLLYATRQVERIVERVEYVADMPTLGHPVHEFPSLSLRETHEGNYRIIYSFDDVSITVVTIVHMKQRLQKSRLRKRRP